MDWIFPVFWLALVIIFLAVEAFTVQMVSIWLAVGALIALIPASFHLSVAVQIMAFLAVSIACICFTRPFVKKVLALRKVSTNADRAIGEIGLVTETVDPSLDTGRIMVDGLSWKARSAGGEVLEAGTRVVVKSIQGVTVTVEKAV